MIWNLRYLVAEPVMVTFTVPLDCIASVGVEGLGIRDNDDDAALAMDSPLPRQGDSVNSPGALLHLHRKTTFHRVDHRLCRRLGLPLYTYSLNWGR
jgi:hypothetical protein